MGRAARIASFVLLSLCLAACGGDDEGTATGAGDTAADETTAGEPVMFDLTGEHDSGQSGTATLTPVEGEAISSFIAVVQLTPAREESLPAHIHNVTCAVYREMTSADDIQGSIEDALNDVRNGESETTVPGALADRTTGEYSINVHDPARDFETVACGDIQRR